MAWTGFLRQMFLELVLFFLACSVVFYIFSGRDSIFAAIYMSAIATVFYCGVTFILRQRAARQRDNR